VQLGGDTQVKNVIRSATLLLAVSGSAVHAQRATPAVSGARAFATEAIGGTIGSAAGIVVGLAIAKPNDCPSSDDVACALQRLGITGVIGVAGATVGSNVAGRLAGTRPSLVGALLGAAAGAATGIAVEHLITEELSQQIGDVGTVLLFSITQGILAAAGSRIVASLK
jgi:hypothetical protein